MKIVSLRLLGVGALISISTLVGINLFAQPPGPPTVQFAQANTYYVGEGGAGGTVTLTVQLDAASALPVTVQYATSNGTAVAPADYVQKNGSITFAPGQTQANIQITIINDGVLKPTRFANVTLSNPINGVLGTQKSATFTIIDNDGPPVNVQFAQATYSVNENAGTASVEVKLSDFAAKTVTVKYQTFDGSAKAGSDFQTTTGTLTFAVGETSKTITIPITDDSIVEPGETFDVVLTEPAGAILGAKPVTTVTILDNDTLSVSASSGSPSPSAIAVGNQTTVLLTGTANVEPPSNGLNWAWSYTVEYAAVPGQYGPPPGDAPYNVTINPGPPISPTVAQLTATFSKAGYWRIKNLKATATYLGQSAHATANDFEVIAIKVDLTPATAYVQSGGGSAILTASVTPPEGIPFVAFSSKDTEIATVVGSAPYVTALGVSAGATQIDATVGNQLAASTGLTVMDVSYGPMSGPVFTKVDFTINTPGIQFFSANTTVRVDAIFSPDEFSEEFFSITHAGFKLRFDPNTPNKVSLAAADVFPSSFLASSNPAIANSMTGTVRGLATLKDGDKQFTVEISFEIGSSGTFGTLVGGVFQPKKDEITVWQANSAAAIQNVSPNVHLYAQITRPMNEFTANPPSSMNTQIRSVRRDGSVVSAGVTVEFTLLGSSGSSYIYQTAKPMIFIENPTYEGEGPTLITITGDDHCSSRIIRLPQ